MKWMRERDALIAQTLAFVQSVTSRKDAGGPLPSVVPEPPPPPSPAPDIAPALPTIAEALRNPESLPIVPLPRAPRPMVPGDFRHEMKSRIASFRAHQERFNREREEYFSATLARLRAAIKDCSPPTRPRG
jgi:hypothetical protein